MDSEVFLIYISSLNFMISTLNHDIGNCASYAQALPWNGVLEIGNWTRVVIFLAGMWRQGFGVQLSHPTERSDG